MRNERSSRDQPTCGFKSSQATFASPLFPTEGRHDDVEDLGVRHEAVNPFRPWPIRDDGHFLRRVLIFQRCDGRNLRRRRRPGSFDEGLALDSQVVAVVCITRDDEKWQTPD